jgi:class 3 adenylate cyclase/predicted ATPase
MSDLSVDATASGDRPAGNAGLDAGSGCGDDEHDAASARLVSTAGRRQLTVLFCDLVGSTELASRLDPEDLRDVVLEYQSICAKVIARYDGHVAQYLGDGLLVYFGYPAAHEDDAQRAVRTGLGIVEAIVSAQGRFQRQWAAALHVRVGIHTGLVVTGEVGAGPTREDLALGQAPNIAARIQSLAAPDAVLLSAATERLVSGFFELEPLGAQELKGIAGTVEVYRAVHESGARTRLDAAGPRGLSALVGRDREAEALRAAWERAEAGDGQVVLVTGDAGIGKSRLVRMLEEHVAARPDGWLTPIQCSPYHQATALFPFIELLERVILRFGREDSPAARAEVLEGWLTESSLDLAATRPLFADLLGLPASTAYPPLSDTPERQRQASIAAIVDVLVRRAARQPVLIVAEDVHWADATSLDLLAALARSTSGARMLLLVTYRSGGRPAQLEGSVPELALERLEPGAGASLVDTLSGGAPLSSEVRRQIVDRTDGVPLFIEELTRNILDSGLLEAGRGAAGALPSGAIPATLQDLLMARLDRTGEHKQLAQLAAVIGRESSLELLASVTGRRHETLRSELDRLLEADILVPTGRQGQERFAFRHALIQETAYGSLLRPDRQALHGRVADAMLAGSVDPSEARPEIIAWHLSHAARPAEAIPQWLAAGQGSLARSANIECISHLTAALEQLEQLPEGPERDAIEMGLRVLIAIPMTLTRGWANPEVGASYERAQALMGPHAEVPQLFPTRVGILTYHLVRGQLATAYDMGLKELELAERFGVDELRLEAELDRGTTSYYLGRTAESREHLAHAIELYDPAQHFPHAFVFGKDPGAVALVHMAGVEWLIGRADDALATANRGRALATTWNHPFSELWAAIGQAFVLQVRGDVEALRDVAQFVIQTSIEQVFPNWLAQGQVFMGWAMAATGQAGEGAELIRQGLGLWAMTGSELYTTYLSFLLVDALRRAGSPEALGVLDEALARVERTGERFWEPELLRVRGELLAEPGDPGAGAVLQGAFDLASSRGQTALELRAATSIVRLGRAAGAPADASALLRPVLGRISQGLATTDVTAARALLAPIAPLAAPTTGA